MKKEIFETLLKIRLMSINLNIQGLNRKIAHMVSIVLVTILAMFTLGNIFKKLRLFEHYPLKE
ncbi:hypothetical protein BpHYR1_030324 [Brachionus plicatilis]|uniref:Uncharacterized protein n=1 Tax=Brachionus plicatilis TaxID=10195 RepID=A0A3M7RRG4_BRAPC|nr:hypothetical protein BpHYR1_030324 [Brachionus plicatilis]